MILSFLTAAGAAGDTDWKMRFCSRMFIPTKMRNFSVIVQCQARTSLLAFIHCPLHMQCFFAAPTVSSCRRVYKVYRCMAKTYVSLNIGVAIARISRSTHSAFTVV